MKPRSTAHIVALVLCVLALFVAQTFGGHRGYICVCGGEPVPTQTSHCYGPHGADCHSDETGCGGGDHQQGSDDRKDHQALGEDVQARPSEATLQVFAPQILTAILPLVEKAFAGIELEAPAVCHFTDMGSPPPLGVTVARTVVLRI